jgi:ectoine hydroxylase-related dioxygenase (phytanoyl-CoA dioxygenase family)
MRDSVERWFESNAGEYEMVNGASGGHIRELVDPMLEAANSFFSCAEDYFGTDKVVVPVNHLLFRWRDDRVDAVFEQRGWKHVFHQDHGLIPTFFPLYAWIALSPVGDNCQGLAFVLPSPVGPTSLATDPERYVAETDGGEIWCPHMEPGDLLLFHQLTIHGSWTVRGKPNTRYSAEFRAGRSADSPEEYRNVLWSRPV